MSGRVEGQILRGSLQQKRKEEGPKESMTFEEAVVAAIDFHGALSGTGSYAPRRRLVAENIKAQALGRLPHTRTRRKSLKSASTRTPAKSRFTKSGPRTIAAAR